MLRAEDLLAARFLYARAPEQREVVRSRVEILGQGPGQLSLLADLTRAKVLTHAQAQFVHDHVERTKRERGAQLYIQLLEAEKVATLEELQTLGDRADTRAIERRLVAAGRLDPQRGRELLAQAQAKLREELERVVKSANQGADDTDSGISATILHEPKVTARLSPTSKAMAKKAVSLLDPSLLASSKKNPASPEAMFEPVGVAFPVPDWVQTDDPRRDERIKEFRILGRIGAGAMGTVYLAAQDGFPKRPVALKLLPQDATEDSRGRFQREILANSLFSHPGALDIYDAGETPKGEQFLAMEFFEGQDLRALLDAEGALPPPLACRVARQVIETLAAAHKSGIVHRDVKPDNILLSPDRSHARLMDFGIAILRDLGEFDKAVFQTMDGVITGTPEYVSPEQTVGDPIGTPADIYSLGCTLYELLTTELPFKSETSRGFINCHMMMPPRPLGETKPDLPESLVSLVDRMLLKQPAERPRTTEVAVTLRSLEG